MTIASQVTSTIAGARKERNLKLYRYNLEMVVNIDTKKKVFTNRISPTIGQHLTNDLHQLSEFSIPSVRFAHEINRRKTIYSQFSSFHSGRGKVDTFLNPSHQCHCTYY